MDEDQHERWAAQCRQVMASVLEVDPEHIFFRVRKRKAGRKDQYQRLDEKGFEKIVLENGLQFRVNLTDYLDSGLFLDHRMSRQWVRQQAAGKKVLNLFAYTGSFSVYAAAGGASQVTTVDMSNTYLNWARFNMEINGFKDDGRFAFVQADVLQYLKQPATQAFDLVVLDPPTFSNSKRMEEFLDIQRDHVTLINDVAAHLSPQGSILFSTNYRRFELDRERLSSWQIRDLTRATTPFDFEGRFSRLCFLLTRR
jgi:23S rRNA (cytosine1962-C5)-methyltransferase